MSILKEARTAPPKPTEKVGPAIAKLSKTDQEEVHEAIMDPEISDPFVADYLHRHTGVQLTNSQIAHYARTRLGRKKRA